MYARAVFALFVLLSFSLISGASEAAKSSRRPSPPKEAAPGPTSPPAMASPAAPAVAAPKALPRVPELFAGTDRVKVVVLDLGRSDSLPQRLVDSLGSTIVETLDRLGAFKAISTTDIVKLLEYQAARQQLGCGEGACLFEIGDALGADYVLFGGLTQAGDKTVIQLALANTKAGRVDTRVSRDYAGASDGLFEEVRKATKLVVRELLAERSGYLALTASEEGATVRIDDVTIGTTPLSAVTVSGGTHTLAVEKEGFVLYKSDFEIREQQTTSKDARLLPSAEYVKRYEEEAGFVRRLALVGFGAGAVGLASGVAAFALSHHKASALDKDVKEYNARIERSGSDYDSLGDRQRTVARLDLIGLLATGIGVAALTTGSVLFWGGSDPDRYRDASTRGTVVAEQPRPWFSSFSAVLSPRSLSLQASF